MLKSQDQRAKFLVDILVEYAESIAQGSPLSEFIRISNDEDPERLKQAIDRIKKQYS